MRIEVPVPEGATLVQAPEGCRLRREDGSEDTVTLEWVSSTPEAPGEQDVVVEELQAGSTRIQVGAFYTPEDPDEGGRIRSEEETRMDAEEIVTQIQILFP